MKKLSLLFLCALFLLSSCSSQPCEIVRSFSAEISASCNGENIKAHITANKQNVLTVRIRSPKAMKGYTYSYKGDALTVKYKTFKVDTQSSYLPNTAFVSVIYNVLKSLNKENNCYFAGAKEAFAEYKGNSDSGKYVISTQYTTGVISKIELKGIDFNADFTNVKIIS